MAERLVDVGPEARFAGIPCGPSSLIGDIDVQHRLHAQVPKEIPAGQVRAIVFLPVEDEAADRWANGVAFEWSAEVSDPRGDIYTLEDGQPVNTAR